MGDIFYLRQQKGAAKTATGKRKLKKDWIAEITVVLNVKEVSGLDKCTMSTLEQLLGAIKDVST